jgi:23S rRNA pseudouridine1911/1915/1917 synthase
VNLHLLYEDDHLLAIDKPALLPVHPTARYHRNTVIKVLQASRPDAPFLSLGHRLDRETSGVMLVSKTRACDRALKKRLERRDGVSKTYLAITWGVPDDGRGSSQFRYERRLELDPTNPLRVKMRITDAPDGLYAATKVHVRQVRERPNGRPYAWVELGLETGRQHQIRVHLAALGSPVVGDKLYGPDERAFARAADRALTEQDVEMLEMPRHALHAARLDLTHPITGRTLNLEAPVPADIEQFWQSLTSPAEPCRDRAGRAPLE